MPLTATVSRSSDACQASRRVLGLGRDGDHSRQRHAQRRAQSLDAAQAEIAPGSLGTASLLASKCSCSDGLRSGIEAERTAIRSRAAKSGVQGTIPAIQQPGLVAAVGRSRAQAPIRRL
jgi:hypothetical protein